MTETPGSARPSGRSRCRESCPSGSVRRRGPRRSLRATASTRRSAQGACSWRCGSCRFSCGLRPPAAGARATARWQPMACDVTRSLVTRWREGRIRSTTAGIKPNHCGSSAGCTDNPGRRTDWSHDAASVCCDGDGDAGHGVDGGRCRQAAIRSPVHARPDHAGADPRAVRDLGRWLARGLHAGRLLLHLPGDPPIRPREQPAPGRPRERRDASGDLGPTRQNQPRFLALRGSARLRERRRPVDCRAP